MASASNSQPPATVPLPQGRSSQNLAGSVSSTQASTTTPVPQAAEEVVAGDEDTGFLYDGLPRQAARSKGLLARKQSVPVAAAGAGHGAGCGPAAGNPRTMALQTGGRRTGVMQSLFANRKA